ncbi:MAG TPA: hypothetical protein VGH61_02530 [Steroidobacteraceae bacterium]
MEERSKAPVPEGSLWKVGRRASGMGIAVGLLLLALSGPLPGRVQLLCASCGVALALLSASVLVSLTAHPSLRWHGISPALGIVLGVIAGALPGLFGGTWLRAGNHPLPRSVVVRTDPRPRNDLQPLTAAAVGPPERLAVTAASTGKLPDAVLSELSYLLDRKARPALDGLNRLLTSVADAPDTADPVTLKVQLEPGVNELSEVAAALEKIEAENTDLPPGLRQAIAGGRPLSALTSSLRQLTLAEGDARGYGAPRLRRLASAADSAGRWLDSVDQQLDGRPIVTRDVSQ